MVLTRAGEAADLAALCADECSCTRVYACLACDRGVCEIRDAKY